MSAGNGDRLARGARSATFGPAQGISQSRWDKIWEEDPGDEKKPEQEQNTEKTE